VIGQLHPSNTLLWARTLVQRIAWAHSRREKLYDPASIEDSGPLIHRFALHRLR